MKNKSQTETVREHLEKYGSITSLEAIHKYLITRLSAVILILRNEGLNIETQKMENNAKNKHFGLYVLKNRYEK